MKLIWISEIAGDHVSQPSTVPLIYRNGRSANRIMSYLDETILILRQYHIPFVDVYHMTRNCVTDKAVMNRWNETQVF